MSIKVSDKLVKFEYYKQNKKKINNELEELGFQNLRLFKTTTDEELNLLILAEDLSTNEEKTEEFFNKEDKDVFLEADTTKQYIYYDEYNNTVKTLINPLYCEESYNKVMEELKQLTLRVVSNEEKTEVALRESFMKSIKNRREVLKEDIKRTENYIKDYMGRIKINSEERIEKMMELESIQIPEKAIEEVLNNFKQAQELPMVKNLRIDDKGLKFTFENVKVKGKVNTGEREEKEGIMVPKMETKTLELGTLNFEVRNGEFYCYRPEGNITERNFHPHVSSENNVCLGAEAGRASNLASSHKYKELIMLMYSWAFSYSEEGGPYVKLEEFFEED